MEYLQHEVAFGRLVYETYIKCICHFWHKLHYKAHNDSDNDNYVIMQLRMMMIIVDDDNDDDMIMTSATAECSGPWITQRQMYWH